MILVAPIKRAVSDVSMTIAASRVHTASFECGGTDTLVPVMIPESLARFLWRHSRPNGAIYGAKCGILRQRG